MLNSLTGNYKPTSGLIISLNRYVGRIWCFTFSLLAGGQ